MLVGKITFPEYTGVRCLMMPYTQGDPDSIPDYLDPYREIVATTYVVAGEIGYLTIDESPVTMGVPHRGARAKFGRALHTEAGLRPFSGEFVWGGGGWGGNFNVRLEPDVAVLLASGTDGTCAIWETEHRKTSTDGDIGDWSGMYPYEDATILGAGEVHMIGILTPHESLPVAEDGFRQFLRIVSSGVHGREPYFTENPLLAAA